jgi:hypothetical protein
VAIIGFIFLCVFGLGLSLLFLVACSQMLPKYNIGGVPNKWYDRVIILVFAVILYYLWKFIFEYSPFTLTIAN